MKENLMKNISLSLLVLLCLTILLVGACSSTGGSEDDLTGVVWQWSSMEETLPASQSIVPNPADYTITFNDDGSATIKADCNMVDASYTLDGNSLTITPGASSMAFCGEDSIDVIYLTSLEKVTSYSITEGTLNLIFANDGGQMHFNNGGTAG
jgi:heat shock protein HslJ